ncbi:putative calcium-binding protein,FG-GAP repeat protein [Hyella patelloides LEGE 07179]|uniref:Putative calcium-binding protein,FG-GAP repeat protein n=1 Tax=Hyella patelloides LEGE 07179 TaxID=945734 RepID=A0A563W090_9CYAN|nr:FG-GAP repeat protein [Hyella patelloides]VEP17037.1 putative calcium-binding protein,FG-GAP repeat protein [Hyella patelloides LEGE 07179]
MATNINLSELDGSQGFVIQGINEDDRAGNPVSNAGDINGDGFDDLIISAYLAGSNDAGESYVVFGGSDVGDSGSIGLSELDGSNGFVISGIDEDDSFGRSVSNAGDINGDGIDDIIIGAPYAGTPYAPYIVQEGESYVIFGGSDVGNFGSIELSELDGSKGFVIRGDNYDRSGRSVSNAGDINGDGIDDIIIGAPYVDVIGGGGESYVVFGSNDVGNSGSLELSELDGNNGFTITGVDVYDRSGWSVSNAGDINGDGIDDLLIGAPNAEYGYYSNYNSGSSDGESYVVFGSNDIGNSGNLDLENLDGSNGFVLSGIDNYDRAGSSVSNAGDINGDGIDDLLIGTPRADVNSNENAGESYVVFGGNDVGNSGSLDLENLDGSNGFIISGINEYDVAGVSVSNAGDVNGDGHDDIIIGAPGVDEGGESYVIFGNSDGFDANIDLANLDDSTGFAISGIDGGDSFGSSVSSAGDVNGDGLDDLLIGAPGADVDGNENAGESYVIFGFTPLELIGTNGDDVLTGDTGSDNISGLGGDDTLSGLAGDDEILGGSGNDEISGGEGDDLIQGQSGNDLIAGDDGNDSLTGNSGDDEISGGEGNDTVRGGSESDTISGGSGNDLLVGNSEDDTISGDLGRDTIRGGDGDDSLRGNFANDLIRGNAGADLIRGDFGNDNLAGGSENDTLIGGDGDDFLSGNTNDDRLIGVDSINANSDFGRGELDTLTGGAGSDTFVLGNADRVFYDDGDNFTLGDQDLAFITDFDASQDMIQLQGSAEFYRLDLFPSAGTINAELIYDPGASARGETIAFLTDVDTDLTLEDSAFEFV